MSGNQPPAPATAERQTLDGALLVRAGNGDQRAAQELVRLLSPRLLGYARRVLGDSAEAEDVVQETLLRLWRVAPEWRQGEAQVSTWAYRVAVNLCTDRLRARKPGVALESAPEPEDERASAAAEMTIRARLAALDAALAELPERQRQAVVLRHIEELSNPEIAGIMDISVEAVESLTARGKRALAALLSGQKDALGYEDDRE